MLEIMMGGSKPLPKSQFNVLDIEVLCIPQKVMSLNVVDIEVLSVAQPSITFNVLDIEVLTTTAGV